MSTGNETREELDARRWRFPDDGPFSIGSDMWPGLAKTAEEAGELVQVCMKLIASGGRNSHWDGSDLVTRLEEEIADVHAAMTFLMGENGLDSQRIRDRAWAKLALFHQWHNERAAVHQCGPECRDGSEDGGR